jgi:hypothetical protein
LQNTPEEITVSGFDNGAADAWFRTREHERDAMPVELLERDKVLASVMPGHGEPPPGGDEAPPDSGTEEEEPEGDPS